MVPPKASSPFTALSKGARRMHRGESELILWSGITAAVPDSTDMTLDSEVAEHSDTGLWMNTKEKRLLQAETRSFVFALA